MASEYLSIKFNERIAGGAPTVYGRGDIRIEDIVDRVRAGDSASDVAEDFGVRVESVSLLMQVAEVLAPGPDSGELQRLLEYAQSQIQRHERVARGSIGHNDFVLGQLDAWRCIEADLRAALEGDGP